MRPHRQYVDDLSAVDPPGTGLSLLKEAGPFLGWPSRLSIAAARLARAWEYVKRETERGGASELALIEMHQAARRLKALTGKKDLWSALAAVSEAEA